MTADPQVDPPEVVDVYQESPQQAFVRRQQHQGLVGSRRTKVGPLTRLLLHAAGADLEILRMCPHEIFIYTALGGSVVASALLAGVSMSLAMTLAFGSLPWGVTVLAGVGFAMLNLNLDRWLAGTYMTGIGQRVSLRERLLGLVPRVLLGLVLGIVVAEPLVLAVFRPEIRQELAVQRAEQVQIATQPVEEQLRVTDARIAQLGERLVRELSGTGSSSRSGVGPVSQELRSAIAQLRDQRESLVEERQRLAAAVIPPEGLLAQVQALDDVTQRAPAARLAAHALRLFLLLLYVTPGLLLLSSSGRRDTYHALLELRVQRVVNEARHQLQKQEDVAEARRRLD